MIKMNANSIIKLTLPAVLIFVVDSPLSWRKMHQQAYHILLSFSLASIPKNENSPLRNDEFG